MAKRFKLKAINSMDAFHKFRSDIKAKMKEPRVEINTLDKKKKNCNIDYYFLNHLKNKRIRNADFKNYYEYCKSDYFKLLKEAVLRKANYKCRLCNKKAKTAHHKFYRSKWTDTKIIDCIPVCHSCHEKVHLSKSPLNKCVVH